MTTETQRLLYVFEGQGADKVVSDNKKIAEELKLQTKFVNDLAKAQNVSKAVAAEVAKQLGISGKSLREYNEALKASEKAQLSSAKAAQQSAREQTRSAKELVQSQKELAKESEALFRTRAALTKQRVAEALKADADAIKEAAKNTKDFNAQLGSFGAALSNLAQGLGVAGSLLGRFYGNAIKDSAEFDRVIRNIGVVTRESGTPAIKDLTREIERLGLATTKTPVEIAAATREFVRAGFSATEAAQAIGGIVQASEATGASLEQVGDVVAKTIQQFGLAATDSQRVADLLVNAANSANVNIVGLGESLKFVGTDAKSSNQSLEGTVAVLALLGDAGLQGGQGGRNLASALRQLKIGSAEVGPELAALVKGSTKARTAFELLQVQFRNSDGTLQDLAGKLPELKARLEDLNPNERDVITQALFGTEGSRAVLAAISQSDEKIRSLTGSLQDNSGAAAKASFELQKGLGGALKLIESSLTVANQKIGDLVGSGLEPALRGITEFINNSIPLFAELSEQLAPELAASGKAFADELNRSPELAQNLAKALAEASATLSREMLVAITQLAQFLNENPTALSDAITGLANVLKGVASLAKSTLDLVNTLAKALDGLAVSTAKTAGGTRLGAEAVGSRDLLSGDQQDRFDVEFDKRARVQAGRFASGNRDNRAKIAQEIAESILLSDRKIEESNKKVNETTGKDDRSAAATAIQIVKDKGDKKVGVTRVSEGLIQDASKDSRKSQLKDIEDTASVGEAAIKASADRRILLVQAGVEANKNLEKQAAIEIAQINQEAQEQIIAGKQKEVEAVKAAINTKTVDTAAGNEQIKKLNTELETANTELVKRQSEVKKKEREKELADIDLAFTKQKDILKSQINLNEQSNKLRESASTFAKAASDAQVSANQGEIDSINEAIKLRQQLSELSVTDGDKRAAIIARLAQLGQSVSESEEQSIGRRQVLEDAIAAIKRAQLVANQASDQATIASANERLRLEGLITLENAKQAAQKADNSDEELNRAVANAQASLDLLAKISEQKQAELGITQQTALAEFDRTEKAREFAQQQDINNAKANDLKVTTQGTADAATNLNTNLKEVGKTFAELVRSGANLGNSVKATSADAAELAKEGIQIQGYFASTQEEAQKLSATLGKAKADAAAMTQSFDLGSVALRDQNQLLADRAALQSTLLESEITDLEAQRQKITDAGGGAAQTGLIDVQIDQKQAEINRIKEEAQDKEEESIRQQIANIDEISRLNLQAARDVLFNTQELAKLSRLPDPGIFLRAAQERLRGLGLPEFRSGVTNFEGGFAKVHGGEAVVTPDGNTSYVNAPEVTTYLPKGTDVITARQVQRGNNNNGDLLRAINGLRSDMKQVNGNLARPNLTVSSPNPVSDAADILADLTRRAASRRGIG